MESILDEIRQGEKSLSEHFRYLHQNPGLGFEVQTAAGYIAGRLRACGYAVTEGIGKTGVVGQLKIGDGPSIGLRADTDALPVHEAAIRSWPGRRWS